MFFMLALVKSIHLEIHFLSPLDVCYLAYLGIDLIPTKYLASIADSDTDPYLSLIHH